MEVWNGEQNQTAELYPHINIPALLPLLSSISQQVVEWMQLGWKPAQIRKKEWFEHDLVDPNAEIIAVHVAGCRGSSDRVTNFKVLTSNDGRNILHDVEIARKILKIQHC